MKPVGWRVEFEDEENGGREGKSAEQHRRVDHCVTGRDDPEHGEDNDEPRRHGGEQRPRDRVAGSFDQEPALRHRLDRTKTSGGLRWMNR